MAILGSEMTETKFCTICEAEKPLSKFYCDKRLKGTQRISRCKRCHIDLQDSHKKETIIVDKLLRDEKWSEQYDKDAPSQVHPGNWPEGETWRCVPAYPLQYEVSDHGRVRSHWEFKGNNYYRRPVPHVLIPHKTASDYFAVTLVDWCTGQKKTHTIHGLVIWTFRGWRPSDDYVCGHRDGDRYNNDLKNLEWITFRENESDKRKHGRARFGRLIHNAKLNDDVVREMRRRAAIGIRFAQIARDFSVSKHTVISAVRGETWRHVV